MCSRRTVWTRTSSQESQLTMKTPSSLPPEPSTDATPHNPVHEGIVRVAESGPSTRTLVIAIAVSLLVLFFLAVTSGKRPAEDRLLSRTTTDRAAPTPAPNASIDSRGALLPQADATVRRSDAGVSSATAAPTTGFIPPSRADSSVRTAVGALAPNTSAVAAPPSFDAPRPDAPTRVVDAHGESMPIGATSRSAAEGVLAAVPPAREREADTSTSDRPFAAIVGRDEAPRPRPVAEPQPRPVSEARPLADRPAAGSADQASATGAAPPQ